VILDVDACQAADLDGSATVDVTEVQRAAIAFLLGCP
jgi:hypothetical protein